MNISTHTYHVAKTSNYEGGWCYGLYVNGILLGCHDTEWQAWEEADRLNAIDLEELALREADDDERQLSFWQELDRERNQ